MSEKKNEKVMIKNNIRTLRFFANEMTQQQLAELVGQIFPAPLWKLDLM